MRERTEAKFHVKLNGLKEEAEFISSPATKIPLGTWKNVEEDKAEKLEQRTTDLTVQMAEAGIIPDDILGLTVNQAANSVQEVNDELNSEDSVEKDEECFADLKMKLEKAFEHNQTIKSAKTTKIKELLQGNAKNHISDSMENIDDIYKALDRAFTDPTRLLNYKKKPLTKLGTIPSYDTKGGTKVVYLTYSNKLQ